MIRFLFKLVFGMVAVALMGIGTLITGLALTDNAAGLEKDPLHAPFRKESEPESVVWNTPAEKAVATAPAPIAAPAAPEFHRLSSGSTLAGWTGASQFSLDVGDNEVAGWVGVARVKWAYDGRWIRGALDKQDVALEVGPEWIRGKMGLVENFEMRRPDFKPAPVATVAAPVVNLAAAIPSVSRVASIFVPRPTLNATMLPVLGTHCMIATALADRQSDLWTFRLYRDKVLSQSRLGHMLTKFYYRTSPTISSALHASPILKAAMRCVLRPVLTYARSRIASEE